MKAIIICLALNSLLFIFEILACDQMDSLDSRMIYRSYQGRHLWLIVFMPLFLTSPVSIAACVWGFKHDRGLEVNVCPYIHYMNDHKINHKQFQTIIVLVITRYP